jgi:hypothetical protein
MMYYASGMWCAYPADLTSLLGCGADDTNRAEMNASANSVRE